MIKDLKKRSLHRSRIIQGQLESLIEMIQSEQYCVDIMTQSLAIQRALRSLNKLVLENHLRTHAAQAIASSDCDIREKALKELVDLYELHNVRGK